MLKAGVGYNPQYVVIYPISTLAAVALEHHGSALHLSLGIKLGAASIMTRLPS